MKTTKTTTYHVKYLATYYNYPTLKQAKTTAKKLARNPSYPGVIVTKTTTKTTSESVIIKD